MDLITFLLMTQPENGEGGRFMGILPLILIIVVFYFFMIRPQVRRQKEMKNFREALKKGDKIITTGGIYGKINNISENVITIDVGNNIILKVDKSAILKDSSDLQQRQK